MPALEIQYASQETEVRRISKGQPLSIGRHASNDICIDEPDVAPIHCRVSWNRTHFEVASANRDGVDVNGTPVLHAVLKVGDTLRIGSTDITLRDGESPGETGTQTRREGTRVQDRPESQSSVAQPQQQKQVDSESIPLAPVTEELAAAREGWHRVVSVASPKWTEANQANPMNQHWKPETPKNSPAEIDEALGLAPGEQEEPEGVLPTRLTYRLGESRVRPGEQEALRSPLILGMFAVFLALALAAAAIYFVIGRESTQQQFDAAVAEFDAKRYGEASELFQKFVNDHGRHRLTDQAYYGMWNSRVLKEIGGSAASWKRGLDEVNKYIDANRDRNDFKEHYSELTTDLTQIALGAARSAEKNKDPALLEVSSAAQALLPRYFPEGALPADLAARIREAFVKAQDAIVQHDQFTEKIAAIEKANTDRQPMTALAVRRELLARYPSFSGDAKLAALLKQTLDVEKSLVIREEPNKTALTKESAGNQTQPVILTLHTRSRTEEPAGTRPVFVLAKDDCFAVDHATGEPIWRRVIGLETPFFPLSVDTAVPGLLLFDTNRLSLVLVARQTGKLIWEQPLKELASGAPLVDQGQIYLATSGNHLYKIGLETGLITTRLIFSQKILSPPALVRNKERLIVAGDASLIYTLTTSPLGCLRVDDLGHAADSLVNGVMEMGSLALITESGLPSGTKLSALDAAHDDTWLKQVKIETVEGQVRDAPVTYGKMLFIASDPARITAFSVSDTPGQESLAKTASIAIPKQEDGPIFLSPGPDGQLWMAGSSLRRLQLKLNAQSFSLDPVEAAIGMSSQPLQVVGQYVFGARRLPYARSVFFSQIDREPMTGQWRTVFGSSIIGHAVGKSGDITCIGEAGEVFSVSPSDFVTGGFKRSANLHIVPPADTRAPLRATPLSDGQIAIDCISAKPMLWLISSAGQSAGSFRVEQPLEAPPLRLSSGLALPLPGRLRLVSLTNGLAIGEDFVAPVEAGKPARWTDVARLGESEFLAIDNRGRLRRMQYRAQPVRHLAEVVTKMADHPTDVRVAVAGSRVAYADIDGLLHVLDAATLDSVFTDKLPAPAVSPLWALGSLVVLETRDHQLMGYDVHDAPKRQFQVSLGKTGPAGPPSRNGDRLVVANRDGTVLGVDLAKGTVSTQFEVGQPLSGGVIAVGGYAVVTAIDGSLHRIDLAPQPKSP